MTTEILRLPLPHKCLSPNARPNRFAKTREVRIARTTASREAYLLYKEWDFPAGFVITSIKYVAYWKTKGTRKDDTNLIGSCKAYEDGLQDAVRQDDRTWEIKRPEHLYDPEDPRLEIHIEIQPL